MPPHEEGDPDSKYIFVDGHGLGCLFALPRAQAPIEDDKQQPGQFPGFPQGFLRLPLINFRRG
jgi:hypothetical protein